MSKRTLAWTAAVALIIALVSMLAFDRGIALAVRQSGIESAAIVVSLREFFDILTGSGIGRGFGRFGHLLLGASLVVIGMAWLLARKTNPTARALVFTGLVQLGTIEAGSLVKVAFGRLRPYQLLEHNDWSHIWFAGGSSFPSGHVAFFWGLFLPLAYLYPKYRVPLLVVPVFIAFARVDENVHFLSDVLGSIALAAIVTLIAAVVFGRWIRPADSPRS
ncbi:MAG TPA: phosphatase PAP2 family protein [Rudaea sp.]|nr:phosphatase PAP2 family protein [Rudaea sp.]